MLKNEYINKYFFDINGLPNDTMHMLWLFGGYVIPFIVAILYTWVLPELTRRAYRKERSEKAKRKIIKEEEEAKYIKAKNATLRANEQNAQKEFKIAQERKKAIEIDPTIEWRDDYNKLSKQNDFNEVMEDLSTCMYVYSGDMYNSSNGYSIRENTLRTADVYNLATIDSGFLSLTDKGKYFVRTYDQNRDNAIKLAVEEI